MTDQLPADIAEAIETFALACEDMGASYDSRGFPSHERERVAAEANAALYAVILKHLGRCWRPIESVPKDGKKVMLYRPLAGESNDPVISIRRTTKTSQHCWPDTVPPGCDGQNFTEGACYATHWMPLPAPPATDLGRSALSRQQKL